jgi:hypothetical protein
MAWGASVKDKEDVLIDTCLVVSNEKMTVRIEQGKCIFVRIGERKIKGGSPMRRIRLFILKGRKLN